MNIEENLYPEYLAGGFTRNNKRLIFYSRVNSLLKDDMTVLEFGAGRGKFADIGPNYLSNLGNFRGRCKQITGIDVDPSVLTNPLLDKGVQYKPGEPLPFDDATFDMIVSWDVFEHVDQPQFYANELSRVLKPGGWLCAQTPNKWGYVGIGARMIPNAWHVRFLKKLAPEKHEEDTFPTVYKMNSLGAIRKYFSEARFDHHSYIFNGPPSYHANKLFLARMILLYNWLMPEGLGQTLHIFLRKKAL